MEEFLLMPGPQSYSYPADKRSWKSEELGPLNFDETMALFDDFAMVNASSFEFYMYELLNELIRLRNLETLNLYLFFSKNPSIEEGGRFNQDAIENCISNLKKLPIEIRIAWFQLDYSAKQLLQNTSTFSLLNYS